MDSWGERCTNWAYQYLFDLVDRECLGLGAWPSKLLQLSVESWGSDSSRCTTSYQMRLRFEVTSGGSQLKMSSLTIPDPSRPASFAADSLCTIAAIVIASESHERAPRGLQSSVRCCTVFCGQKTAIYTSPVPDSKKTMLLSGVSARRWRHGVSAGWSNSKFLQTVPVHQSPLMGPRDQKLRDGSWGQWTTEGLSETFDYQGSLSSYRRTS